MQEKGLNLLMIIQINLLLIKTTGASDISWWLVTSPLWGLTTIGLVVILAMFTMDLVIGSKQKKK